MYYIGQMVMSSYKPLHLEVGMFFRKRNMERFLKKNVIIERLTSIPENETSYIEENGYPIDIYIIDPITEAILAGPEEIGWMDEGEHTDLLHDITLGEINRILDEYEGEVGIMMEDVPVTEEGLHVAYQDKKVILTYTDNE